MLTASSSTPRLGYDSSEPQDGRPFCWHRVDWTVSHESRLCVTAAKETVKVFDLDDKEMMDLQTSSPVERGDGGKVVIRMERMGNLCVGFKSGRRWGWGRLPGEATPCFSPPISDVRQACCT